MNEQADAATGVLLESGALRFERLLPGPIEKVWSYLVEPEKRAKWLAGGETELKAGGAMTLAFDNSRLSRPDDPPPEKYRQYAGPLTMRAEVKRCEAPRHLSFLWFEEDGRPSLVEVDLKEEGDKVRLTLTHKDVVSEVVGALAGWQVHLGILADVLEGKPPRSFWSSHTAAEAAHEKRLGAG